MHFNKNPIHLLTKSLEKEGWTVEESVRGWVRVVSSLKGIRDMDKWAGMGGGREYSMIYRGPDFLPVIWFGSSPPLPSPPLIRPRRYMGRLRKKGSLRTGEGGEGAKSDDGEKTWSSINHLILAGWENQEQSVQNVQKEQEYISKLQNSAEKETMYKKVSRQSRELLQSSFSLYKNGKTQKSESCAPLQIHIRSVHFPSPGPNISRAQSALHIWRQMRFSLRVC